ncbi:MAG TPA: hypothetical protein VGL70_08305, partial [Candidatus Binatia bacterium]
PRSMTEVELLSEAERLLFQRHMIDSSRSLATGLRADVATEIPGAKFLGAKEMPSGKTEG